MEPCQLTGPIGHHSLHDEFGLPVPGFPGSFSAAWHDCVLSLCDEASPPYRDTRKTGECYVYLVLAYIRDILLVKIGISHNVNRRYKQHCTNMPFAKVWLDRVAVAWSRDIALIAEQEFCKVCSPLSVGGEWFLGQE